MIRFASPDDAAAICSIYNYYVENTTVSFEEVPVRTAEMEERIRKIGSKYPYLVWQETDSANAGDINGYAYVNTWRERSAYRYSAETSIYLRDGFQRKGIGNKLMEKLLEEVRKTEIHTLVAGITLPNDGSVGLHEKFGFKRTACFSEIGRKFGKWIDVCYWQLILN